MKKTMDEKIKELETKTELYKLAKEIVDDLSLRAKWYVDEEGNPVEWNKAKFEAILKLIEILENL